MAEVKLPRRYLRNPRGRLDLINSQGRQFLISTAEEGQDLSIASTPSFSSVKISSATPGQILTVNSAGEIIGIDNMVVTIQGEDLDGNAKTVTVDPNGFVLMRSQELRDQFKEVLAELKKLNAILMQTYEVEEDDVDSRSDN